MAFYDAEALSYNTWYNVRIELSNNLVKWYLNGENTENDIISFSNISQESNSVPPMAIGVGNIVYPEFFNGFINDIQISTNNGLLAHWDFNQVEGGFLFDVSGNNYDGEINGASWSGESPPSGCLDPYADNYNTNAFFDDGSCIYFQEAVTFTKEDYADPNSEEAQDRILGNVWITRGNNKPLYNAALEGSYDDSHHDKSISPANTEWADGPTANHSSILYIKI